MTSYQVSCLPHDCVLGDDLVENSREANISPEVDVARLIFRESDNESKIRSPSPVCYYNTDNKSSRKRLRKSDSKSKFSRNSSKDCELSPKLDEQVDLDDVPLSKRIKIHRKFLRNKNRSYKEDSSSSIYKNRISGSDENQEEDVHSENNASSSGENNSENETTQTQQGDEDRNFDHHGEDAWSPNYYSDEYFDDPCENEEYSDYDDEENSEFEEGEWVQMEGEESDWESMYSDDDYSSGDDSYLLEGDDYIDEFSSDASDESENIKAHLNYERRKRIEEVPEYKPFPVDYIPEEYELYLSKQRDSENRKLRVISSFTSDSETGSLAASKASFRSRSTLNGGSMYHSTPPNTPSMSMSSAFKDLPSDWESVLSSLGDLSPRRFNRTPSPKIKKQTDNSSSNASSEEDEEAGIGRPLTPGDQYIDYCSLQNYCNWTPPRLNELINEAFVELPSPSHVLNLNRGPVMPVASGTDNEKARISAASTDEEAPKLRRQRRRRRRRKRIENSSSSSSGSPVRQSRRRKRWTPRVRPTTSKAQSGSSTEGSPSSRYQNPNRRLCSLPVDAPSPESDDSFSPPNSPHLKSFTPLRKLCSPPQDAPSPETDDSFSPPSSPKRYQDVSSPKSDDKSSLPLSVSKRTKGDSKSYKKCIISPIKVPVSPKRNSQLPETKSHDFIKNDNFISDCRDLLMKIRKSKQIKYDVSNCNTNDKLEKYEDESNRTLGIKPIIQKSKVETNTQNKSTVPNLVLNAHTSNSEIFESHSCVKQGIKETVINPNSKSPIIDDSSCFESETVWQDSDIKYQELQKINCKPLSPEPVVKWQDLYLNSAEKDKEDSDIIWLDSDIPCNTNKLTSKNSEMQDNFDDDDDVIWLDSDVPDYQYKKSEVQSVLDEDIVWLDSDIPTSVETKSDIPTIVQRKPESQWQSLYLNTMPKPFKITMSPQGTMPMQISPTTSLSPPLPPPYSPPNPPLPLNDLSPNPPPPPMDDPPSNLPLPLIDISPNPPPPMDDPSPNPPPPPMDDPPTNPPPPPMDDPSPNPPPMVDPPPLLSLFPNPSITFPPIVHKKQPLLQTPSLLNSPWSAVPSELLTRQYSTSYHRNVQMQTTISQYSQNIALISSQPQGHQTCNFQQNTKNKLSNHGNYLNNDSKNIMFSNQGNNTSQNYVQMPSVKGNYCDNISKNIPSSKDDDASNNLPQDLTQTSLQKRDCIDLNAPISVLIPENPILEFQPFELSNDLVILTTRRNISTPKCKDEDVVQDGEHFSEPGATQGSDISSPIVSLQNNSLTPKS